MEESFLPDFCGVTHNEAKWYREDSLAMLKILRQFSADAFARYAENISQNSEMMRCIWHFVLYQPSIMNEFDNSPLSLKNILSYSLKHFYKEYMGFYFEKIHSIFNLFPDEIIKALPEFVFKSPEFVNLIYKDIKTNERLKQAAENCLVDFCDKNNADPYFLTMVIETLAVQPKYKEQKLKWYEKFFNRNQDPNKAMFIIWQLMNNRTSEDVCLAIDKLAMILKVPENEKDLLFQQRKQIDFSELVEYYFQRAKADLQTQMTIMHGVFTSHDFRTNSLSYLFKRVYHSAQPTEVEQKLTLSNETYPNVHYATVMNSLKKPLGISLAQLDQAVAWWTDQLRKYPDGSQAEHLGTKMVSLVEYAQSDIPPPTEKQRNVFSTHLKQILTAKIVGKPFFTLQTDYDPERELGEAAEVAKINGNLDLPWKITMDITGDTAEKKGFIEVQRMPLEQYTAQQQEAKKSQFLYRLGMFVIDNPPATLYFPTEIRKTIRHYLEENEREYKVCVNPSNEDKERFKARRSCILDLMNFIQFKLESRVDNFSSNFITQWIQDVIPKKYSVLQKDEKFQALLAQINNPKVIEHICDYARQKTEQVGTSRKL